MQRRVALRTTGRLVAAVLTAAVLVARAGQAPAPVDETSRTAAAVIAVDKHWGEAEIAADNAYLDELLLAEYRSVRADGTSNGKSKVPRKPMSAAEHEQMRAYMLAHPVEPKVVISGDTAVLTWYDPALGPERGVHSADIFVYQGGHWHALYSQHSSAGDKE